LFANELGSFLNKSALKIMANKSSFRRNVPKYIKPSWEANLSLKDKICNEAQIANEKMA
jgi:hypothetical protein